MTQAPLFLFFHLLGVALALAIGRRSDPLLACALGFPIGLAAAVLVLLLALAVGAPYRVDVTIALFAASLIGAVVAAVRRGGLTRSSGAVVATWTAVFAVAALGVSSLNLSRLAYDSYRLVFFGRLLGERMSLHEMLPQLQSWGSFQIVAQSLRRLTAEDYLFSLQPMLGLSFVPLFALLLHDGARALAVTPRRAVVLLLTVALFTIASFHHHLYFIHTNLASAIYLLIFLATLWRAEATGDPSGLGIGFVALTAFAFQRVEGPLFALVAMAVAVLPSELPRRRLTPWLVGFTALVVAWHVLLSRHVPEQGPLLTRDRCLLTAGLCLAFLLVWLALAHPRLARMRRAFPPLAAALLFLAVAVAFIIKPRHMVESAQAWLSNLYLLPVWNQTWVAIILLLLVGLLLERPRAGRAIAYAIPLSLALTLLLAFGRVPYRFGLNDSAERMTVHLLPLLFFYIGLKVLVPVGRPGARSGDVASSQTTG